MIKRTLLLCLFFIQSTALSKGPMDEAKLSAPLPANLWIEMSKMAQPAVVGVFLDIDIKRTHMRRDPLFEFLEEFYGGSLEFEDPRETQRHQKHSQQGESYDRRRY